MDNEENEIGLKQTDSFDIVFDATTASAHKKHAPMLRVASIRGRIKKSINSSVLKNLTEFGEKLAEREGFEPSVPFWGTHA